MGRGFNSIDLKSEEYEESAFVFPENENENPYKRRLSYPVISRNVWKGRLIKCIHVIVYLALLCLIGYIFMLDSYYQNLHKKAPAKLVFNEDCKFNDPNQFYKERAKNVTREFEAKLNSENWNFFKKYPANFTAFVLPSPDGLNPIKLNGTLLIRADPEVIANYMCQNPLLIPKFDGNIRNVTVLHIIDNTTQILRLETFKIGPIAPREVIILMHSGKLSKIDGYFCVMDSIELESHPENDKFVRAYTSSTGYIFYINPDNNNTLLHQSLLDGNPKIPWIPFRDALIVSAGWRSVKEIKNYFENLFLKLK